MQHLDPPVYLDNASTTRVAPEVLDAMVPYLTEHYGNASSIHGMGRATRIAVESAREHVAALFDAEPSEIVFTSGGTEADVWAIRQAGRGGSRRRIVTSPAEHHAVLRTCEALQREGLLLTMLPGTPDSMVATPALEAALSEDVALVSVMHGNNETGVANPIETAAVLAKQCGALFHCDTVQTVGKLPVSSKRIPFDFAVASAHKLHGPKGIGALYVRHGIALAPLMTGGAQERGRRGGTENVASIVGFGMAAQLALRHGEEAAGRWNSMRAVAMRRLETALPGIVVHGGESALPHILAVSFPWDVFALDGETLLMNLDLEGLAVSSGSACTAGSPEPSHVIRSMGYDARTAAATVRMSYGRFTTSEEAERGVETIISVVQRMRGRSRR